MIGTASFAQVPFCNFCHTKPATGWVVITDEDSGEMASHSICDECKEQMDNEEYSHDN